MSNVTPLFVPGAAPTQVAFDRHELSKLFDLYGRFVAAGLFRDYAIDMNREAAVFSAFERATDRPDVQIVKQPELAHKQGVFALLNRDGTVLRRGQELRSVLAVLERKLLKAVTE
jgi:hypothetical protein